jgi:hypothetical protein
MPCVWLPPPPCSHQRCVCPCAGVSILHDVLTNTMPDSFFPGPTSFANEEGYAVQVLSTVQVRKQQAGQGPGEGRGYQERRMAGPATPKPARSRRVNAGPCLPGLQ